MVAVVASDLCTAAPEFRVSLCWHTRRAHDGRMPSRARAPPRSSRPARAPARRAPSSTTPVGLPITQLVATLGGGLLTVVVDAGGPTVDDLTLAEPGPGVFGQAGDLLLGVGVDRPAEAARPARGRGRRRQRRRRAAASRRSQPAVGRRGPRRRRPRRAGRPGVLGARRVAAARGARPGGGRAGAARRGTGARRAVRPRGRLRRAGRRPDHHRGHPVARARLLLDARTSPTPPGSRPSSAAGCPTRSSPPCAGRGVFRRLARSDQPFFVPAGRGLGARLVVPVRAGGEWLGSIWAVVEERAARARCCASLSQTSSVVALHLLRLRSQADLARRVDGRPAARRAERRRRGGRGLAARRPVARRRARRAPTTQA